MDIHERPDRLNSESLNFERKGRRKPRITIWFSKENYIFLEENYKGRISEIMDAFASFLRINQPITSRFSK